MLREIEPDVEVLLVNRLGPARGFAVPKHYALPTDECYKLVWLIRTLWRGLSGGAELWLRLAVFFADLRARAGVSHA